MKGEKYERDDVLTATFTHHKLSQGNRDRQQLAP